MLSFIIQNEFFLIQIKCWFLFFFCINPVYSSDDYLLTYSRIQNLKFINLKISKNSISIRFCCLHLFRVVSFCKSIKRVIIRWLFPAISHIYSFYASSWLFSIIWSFCTRWYPGWLSPLFVFALRTISLFAIHVLFRQKLY